MSNASGLRWFQFGIGTLLLLFAAISIAVRFVPKPTPTELDQHVDFELSRRSLVFALDYIAQRYDLSWSCDESAFASAGLKPPDERLLVDELFLRDVTLGEVLNKLLHPRGFAYRLEHGKIVVVPQPSARKNRE